VNRRPAGDVNHTSGAPADIGGIAEGTTATVDFRILTGLDVRVGNRSLPVIAAKQRTVLAILLLHPNEVVQIDLLVEGVWGGHPPASARNLIKTYVWRLRQLLDAHEPVEAPSRIATVADGYALRVQPGELDTQRFERLVRSGRAALADGNLDLAAAQLSAALAQWPGEALRDTPLEGRFAAELHALGERRLAVLQERISLDMRLGRFQDLIPELQTLIAAEPLHETWHAQLVRALYQSGRRMAALAAYSAARDILVAELGLEPGAELRSLQRSILTESLAVNGHGEPGNRMPAGGALTGTHGPADLADDRPAPLAAPRQLPSGLSGFVGRTTEIAQIVAGQPPPGSSRAQPAGNAGQQLAVTVLTGAPGSGKSALAVQVAHLLKEQFPDGQLFAGIGTHNGLPRTSRQILGSFLQALGVPASRQPASVSELIGLYRSLTAGKRMLILLDDVRNEVQARTLLPAPGASTVIVTSRRILVGLEEAWLVNVGMLPAADAATLLIRSSGRAGTDPQDAGVARTVRLCGGLALALRIAGARLAARPDWTFDDMADRLANEHGRLGDLIAGDLNVRAAFSRSYHYLDPAAQHAFRQAGLLSAGYFTAAVLAGRGGQAELERALERLVDANLLQASVPGRFRMHRLLRIFAAECAADCGDDLRVASRTAEGCILPPIRGAARDKAAMN
jgi:DNA-binding SARP family transcriptional activator